MTIPFGYNCTRLNSTVATQIVTGSGYAQASLVQAGTIVVTMSLHDSASATSAATMIAQLGVRKDGAATGGTDWTTVPIRFTAGLRAKLNVAAAVGNNAGYIYHA